MDYSFGQNAEDMKKAEKPMLWVDVLTDLRHVTHGYDCISSTGLALPNPSTKIAIY
jgi:hypothetical protein